MAFVSRGEVELFLDRLLYNKPEGNWSGISGGMGGWGVL